jgi:hypothetical protein
MAFDPSDPTTYRVRDDRALRRWLSWVAIASAAPPWIMLVCGHASLVVARLMLGRWPHRMGRDDPKGIPGIMIPTAVFAIGVLLLLPGLMASFGVVIAMLRVCGKRDGLKWFLVMLCAWIAAILLIRLDPAQVGVWMMD